MDATNVKADSGTVEHYYLNRLIQRAIVESKPLLKIYEEECQRHPDISVTVTFKEFQAELQRHCLKVQAHNQHAAVPLKQQDTSHLNKEQNTPFTSLPHIFLPKKRKRPDFQGFHRMPQLLLDRFSPQGTQMNNRFNVSGIQPPSPSLMNVKAEDPTYLSTLAIQLPTHSTSRPPSVQLPVEEEPPPEFIEMSSNPPRMSNNSQFLGISMYQGQVSSDQNNIPVSGGVGCKTEPKDSVSGGTVDGAVQSSTPVDKTSLLYVDNISPLNVRCVKCIKALVTCAVVPCGHCCLCGICGQTALSLKQVCPVCRKSISTVIAYSNLIHNVYR